jgi:hypothetical protein
VLILLNMSGAQQSVKVAVPGFPRARMKALLRTPGVENGSSANQGFTLPPYAVYVGQIGR